MCEGPIKVRRINDGEIPLGQTLDPLALWCAEACRPNQSRQVSFAVEQTHAAHSESKVSTFGGDAPRKEWEADLDCLTTPDFATDASESEGVGAVSEVALIQLQGLR